MELCDTLQDAYGSEYAPKTFVCYGDFRQIPPVVPAGSRGAIVDMSVRRSRTWNAFSVFHLSILHRQAQDPAYGQWVNEIGAGTLPAPHAVAGVLAFAELSLCDTVFTEKEAIDFAFPHLADAGHSATRRILTATNAMVDEFNEAILRTLATTYQMLFFFHKCSSDSLDMDDPESSPLQVSAKFVHGQSPPRSSTTRPTLGGGRPLRINEELQPQRPAYEPHTSHPPRRARAPRRHSHAEW